MADLKRWKVMFVPSSEPWLEAAADGPWVLFEDARAILSVETTASPVVHPTGERTASSKGPPVGPQATGQSRMKRTGSLKEDGQHE